MDGSDTRLPQLRRQLIQRPATETGSTPIRYRSVTRSPGIRDMISAWSGSIVCQLLLPRVRSG
jgi:hypothetical protein